MTMQDLDHKKTTWLLNSWTSNSYSIRLFCFPYSGAGASTFYPWAKAFPSIIGVYPVQLPGRETRLGEPLFTQLQPLVEAAAQALLPYLDKPFACFGHSLGALVSFEIIRYWWRNHSIKPVHLFVSAHPAPQIADYDAPIHALPEVEFIKKIRELNGMSDEVLDNAELLQLILPILRADFEICETYTYVPDGPVPCSISAFAGLRDPYVTRAQLEAWQEHTNAAFALRMFPGDHFYLHTSRSLVVESIARELMEYL